MERTFVLLKPSAVTRRLVGEIIRRIESYGLSVCALKMIRADPERHIARLYEMHKGKPFYKDLVAHLTSGPIVPMVVEGENAVERMRRLVGATEPSKAEVGTIRRDYGISVTMNVIHAADSSESAEREIKIFFENDEIMKY
ncbi:MAG: nucleoside-diphosphate kinase [Candidatus Bathyarchaeia archaeon]